MTDEQSKVLEEAFKSELQKQYIRGLRVGILTVSKIVYDKLNDSSKPLMTRINDVKKYCKVPLDNNNKFVANNVKEVADKIEGLNSNGSE
jgi:hypothetical protein